MDFETLLVSNENFTLRKGLAKGSNFMTLKGLTCSPLITYAVALGDLAAPADCARNPHQSQICQQEREPHHPLTAALIDGVVPTRSI